LTLKQVGECLRKSLDQSGTSLTSIYERIERTGITSPRTASVLAAYLRATVDRLTGVPGDDDVRLGSWWFESNDCDGEGTMLQGCSQLNARFRRALESVEPCAASERLHFAAHVEIANTEFLLALSEREEPEASRWWPIRPVERTPTGLSWLEFTPLGAR
jgi:hypothetical protein